MRQKNTSHDEINTRPSESIMTLRLRQLRAQYGYTQSEISKELNISQQTYSNFEKAEGRLDIGLLKKVCNLYNVSSDYLLGLDDHRERASVATRNSEMRMFKMIKDSHDAD